MNQRTRVFLVLIGIIVLVAGASAYTMIASASYMNSAADYAREHYAEFSVPEPLPGAIPFSEPPVRVEAVARYGDAIEVQITRRYKTLRHSNAEFASTHFYSPSANGWQIVPAPESFWGEQHSITTGARINILHPQRDAKLVQALLKVVDPALEATCQHWQCPPQAKVILQFLPVSDAMGDLIHPSPRLTGVPVNREADEDFWSALTAEAILALASQVGQSPVAAYHEIMRIDLYVLLPLE